MKNILGSVVLCGAVSIAAAQNASTSGPTGQTISGLLMDASCAAISGNPSSSGTTSALSSNDAVRNSSTSTSAVTHSGRSSPTEGIRNNSASTTGTTGTADTAGSTANRTGNDRTMPSDTTRTAGARAADERNRTGDTASGTSTVAGSAGAHHDHAAGTGGAAGNTTTGATSGANSASALGTTGAATDTSAAAGTRARSADTGMTTVREKYAQCMATANTKSFALHANGQLYVIDQAGNDMIRQQMSGEAFRGAMSNAGGQPQWMTVTVAGTPGTGNSLSITSVRK